MKFVDVFAHTYRDSVRLMQMTARVSAVSGVDECLVAMATDLNLEILSGMGFEIPAGVGPDDLIVAVSVGRDGAVGEARAVVERELGSAGQPTSGDALFSPSPPRTVRGAGGRVDANLALISVPGPHAFVEAMDALRAGMHVMLFSDNVPIEHEVALKEEAARRDLIVMGPDCGTAIISGVGLGFADATLPGPAGIVGASGTGIQQLVALLDDAGVGIRHAIGTGSRDLSAQVGARSTLRAVAALDADPEVAVIVVVSKPPDPAVAAAVEQAAAQCGTPVIVAMVGAPGITLEGTALAVCDELGRPRPVFSTWPSPARTGFRGGHLRGYFSGGTLRDEARVIAAGLGDVSVDAGHAGHRLVDFGDDRYTRGRAHPMLDQRLRIDALTEAADDEGCGVVLLDVVLGYGAHPDPASELAPAVQLLTESGIPVVVSLCGTERDPQGRTRQAEALQRAGAAVFASNAAAARHAVSITQESHDG